MKINGQKVQRRRGECLGTILIKRMAEFLKNAPPTHGLLLHTYPPKKKYEYIHRLTHFYGFEGQAFYLKYGILFLNMEPEQNTSQEPKREFPPLPRLEIIQKKDRQKWWNFLRGITLEQFVPHPATLDWWRSLSTAQMNQFRREAKERWGEEGWSKFQLHLRQLRQTTKERARLKRFGKDDSYSVVVTERFADQIDKIILTRIEFAEKILMFAAGGMDLEFLAMRTGQPISTIRKIATPEAIEKWLNKHDLQKAGKDLLQTKCLFTIWTAKKFTISDAFRGLKESGYWQTSEKQPGNEPEGQQQALKQRHAEFAGLDSAVDGEISE